MQLTDTEIKEYQRLYLETFGTKISRDEAVRSGMKLIRLLSLLCEPEPPTDMGIIKQGGGNE